ncbi:MAG: hypothetical protein EA392_11010 [Cryomorphaceae bacterium]|nr:MAG: hypothetical protein EA392_11010 [Cryomorphaceae bacterium]
MLQPSRLFTGFFLVFISLLSGCGSTEDQHTDIDPSFGAYISGFTTGVVSTHDDVLIRLAEPYSGPLNLQTPLPAQVLTFKPSLDGTSSWDDASTIRFTPNKPMKGDTHYKATFRLRKLVDVPQAFHHFHFDFQTIQQNISVYPEGYTTYNIAELERVRYSGRVLFADKVQIEDLEEAFSAIQNTNKLSITWEPLAEKVFQFHIEDVARTTEPGSVELKWKAKALDMLSDGSEVLEIPSLHDFRVLRTTVKQAPEQSIKLHFSDPIADQSLEGLILLEGSSRLTYTIDGHVVTLYPEQRITGNKMLTVLESVRNSANYAMAEAYSRNLAFTEEKPNVRLDTKKTIMPTGQTLVLPFEAVSLKAVDVYVTKVFNNNILQFFQFNRLGESGNINYVGRHIYRKHVPIVPENPGDLHTWNTYFLDLSDVVKVDPGAIYRVELRYKKEYAAYSCDDPETDVNQASSLTSAKDGWTTDGEYFVDNYWRNYRYDWENMDNPCHNAYYSPWQTRASTTVMGADMGLTAKLGGDKQMLVALNDLNNAKPVAGCNISVYDLQQQIIGTGKTGRDGLAMIKLTGKPFLVMAQRNQRAAYLRVDDYGSLSLSRFDVGGTAVQEGVKGYIYGERGVWRPGDSLYLTFVMEDKLKLIPPLHPVKMELYNPLGQLVQERVQVSGLNGFYDFRTSTGENDVTGNYEARFSIGNRKFYKTLKIETVKPNRLKIDFNFDHALLTPTTGVQTKMAARWLHGAKAGNLKADVELTITPTLTKFDKWPGYVFDHMLMDRSSSEPVTIFKGQLNSQGEASIQTDVDDWFDNAPGMLKLSFRTKVFEPGGSFSEDFHSVPYAPFNSFAGVRIPEGTLWGNALETDRNHTIELTSVQPDGKASATKELEVILYKLNRRWWYDSYGSSTFNFLNSSSYETKHETKVQLKNGEGSYNINIKPEDWGRYALLVKDPESGHKAATTFFMDWPYWMRANRAGSDASTILAISSDKEVYEPGETMRLTFPAPEGGQALVSVENGSRVLSNQWVSSTLGEQRFEIPVTANMAPNVYVHVTLIQPHGQTENDRPMRLYGIIPVKVENPDTRLNPIIETAEVYRPESKEVITISEKNGKAMTYTLSVVDEGLLDLTRFRTPDPRNAFYAREALGVRTWDMYDQVIGAMGNKRSNLLTMGGDEEGMDPSQQKAMRFKPMVRHLGPFYLAKGTKTTHEINIPNYLGSVRVMVVAGEEPAYGNAEKAIPVRTPLMVLGTLPRVLGPGETVRLPVNVFAMEPHVKSVKIKLEMNGMLQSTAGSEQTLSFIETGDQLAFFELKVAEKTGIAKIKIKASSGNESSVHEIELDVRSPNPHMTIVRDTVLQPGAEWNAMYRYFGVQGTNDATVELSSFPAINLEKRLSYLMQYPHGCLEQVTSGAFPQLFLNRLVELDAEAQARIDMNVQEGLKALRSFQHSSGGFAYWPGQHEVNEWATNYAGHFMLVASERGYPLSGGLKSGWLRFQESRARHWGSVSSGSTSYSQRTQAYRLYTLALAGSPNIGAMNLMRSMDRLDLSARWMLALAYAESGQPEVAEKMLATIHPDIPEYTEMSYTFGSALRDKSFVLLTLLKLNKKADAANIAKELAVKLGSSNWMSTQTTAFALMAVSEFLGKHTPDGGLRASYNGKSISTGRSVIQEKLHPTAGKGSFSVRNEGSSPMFARLLLAGVPIEGRSERIQKDLVMKIQYMNLEGKAIDPGSLPAGTDFSVEVDIHNPGSKGDLKEVALTQIFPSGWEILNTRMAQSDESEENNGMQATYQDIRDDRVLTYFDIPRGKRVKFRTRLNATYAGSYYLPTVLCAPMYDESVIATEPGRWVQITVSD